jgi:hypothetical protein
MMHRLLIIMENVLLLLFVGSCCLCIAYYSLAAPATELSIFFVLEDLTEGFLLLGGVQQEANELFKLSCRLFNRGSIIELDLAAE